MLSKAHAAPALALALAASLSTPALHASPEGAQRMTHRATGTFEVTLKPQATESVPGATLGRMSLEKTLAGDLVATGKGEMLTALAATDGSGAYVAIEQVTGTLHGRKGSFVFQHTGTMTRGAQQLSITVVPDSGTEQLSGIDGKFTLRIEDGKHFYDFEYSLPQ